MGAAGGHQCSHSTCAAAIKVLTAVQKCYNLQDKIDPMHTEIVEVFFADFGVLR